MPVPSGLLSSVHTGWCQGRLSPSAFSLARSWCYIKPRARRCLSKAFPVMFKRQSTASWAHWDGRCLQYSSVTGGRWLTKGPLLMLHDSPEFEKQAHGIFCAAEVTEEKQRDLQECWVIFRCLWVNRSTCHPQRGKALWVFWHSLHFSVTHLGLYSSKPLDLLWITCIRFILSSGPETNDNVASIKKWEFIKNERYSIF